MGISVQFRCKKCGYTGDLRVGGGLNVKSYLMPALDDKTNEIVSLDINSIHANDPNFIPYTDLRLNRKPFFRTMPANMGTAGHYLPADYNFCPKCKKYKGSFIEYGPLWD